MAVRDVMRNAAARLRRSRPDYLAKQRARVASISDQARLVALSELGPFYGGMSAVEKAISDIRIHGRRYVAMVQLLDLLELGPGPLDVLEIGCNTGFLSRFIKDHHPEHRVVAIDRAPDQIRANQLIDADSEHPVEWVAIEGESVTATLGAGSFDVVFLCEILEHIEHRSEAQHAVLREALASIRDTGVVVITVPYEDRIPSPGHLTEFTRQMLSELVASEAAHLADLDEARSRFDLERHFIVLAGHRPLNPHLPPG
jgi:2-polyprenyl-3-methyl-5-hydroxy-6-metoxy-1,4-benzoquinol methylase